MPKSKALLLIICLVFVSCQSNQGKETADKAKAEIVATEKAFAAMAKKDGIGAAFAYYTAQDAAINYNDKLIKGRNDIKAHYADKKYTEATLEWSPDFVDASTAGDLG